MTTIFPGAIWRPLPAPGRPRRSKGRAVIFHVAVSEGASLFNTFAASGNDSHLYVRRDGSLEQYIDLELVAYASMAANASTISVETQGGVTNPDGEPWTPQQLATLAGIARWAHDTEGVPLQVMANSLPASKGIGWHRLGIDPWRVAGGEVWSSSRGKLCPGAAKIAQVPQIVALAQGTPQEVDLLPDERAALLYLRDAVLNGGKDASPSGRPLKDLIQAAADQTQAIYRPGDPNADANGLVALRQEVADAKTALQALKATSAPVIDEAKLAAALLSNPDAVQALGKAIADNLQLSPRG